MRVLAVGRMRGTPEAALFERYQTRTRPALLLTEVAEGRGADVRSREGAALLAALPGAAFVVALDLAGQAHTSEAFAALLDRWLAQAPVCFLIGGAEGLDGPVLARANAVLSLGSFTWPHLLARAMLAEQLYRARAIAAGHPYHRAGRPADTGVRR